MSECTMSDEFDGLGATEKAGIGATLNRCRALAAKIGTNSVTRGTSTSLTSCRWHTFTPPLSALPMSSARCRARADLDGGDEVAQVCHVAQACADGLKGRVLAASPSAARGSRRRRRQHRRRRYRAMCTLLTTIHQGSALACPVVKGNSDFLDACLA